MDRLPESPVKITPEVAARAERLFAEAEQAKRDHARLKESGEQMLRMAREAADRYARLHGDAAKLLMPPWDHDIRGTW